MAIFNKTEISTEEKNLAEYLYSTLKIMFYDNEYNLSFDSPNPDNLSPYTLWYDFYNWYFNRPQSKVYTFKYSKGEYIFKRKDIKQIHTSSFYKYR